MKRLCLVPLFSAVAFLISTPSFATGTGESHQTLTCTSCHITQPVSGQPVDFVGGDKEKTCNQCHGRTADTASASAAMSLAADPVQTAAIVNAHTSFASIPESMKQHMIQWLNQNGYPLPYNPGLPWSMTCSTCHKTHGAPYPMLLIYNMEGGELCQLCHGGSINTAADWTSTTARRVLYSPSSSGQLQADGTEMPAPPAPKNGDVVTSTVNFPVAAFGGFHRKVSDIGYKVSIPGSVFGTREVAPSNHMYWYFGSDMVTWDTTLETNRQYTVNIIPTTPSASAEANSVTFSVVVNNLTLADTMCTAEGKIRSATIGNEGVRNSLLSKASNACNAMQHGNVTAAKGLLQALINQIEAQRGKHIDAATVDALIAFIGSLLAQQESSAAS